MDRDIDIEVIRPVPDQISESASFLSRLIGAISRKPRKNSTNDERDGSFVYDYGNQPGSAEPNVGFPSDYNSKYDDYIYGMSQNLDEDVGAQPHGSIDRAGKCWIMRQHKLFM